MQIHFYQQKDKPDSTGDINYNWIWIGIGVISTFLFLYLIFTNQNQGYVVTTNAIRLGVGEERLYTVRSGDTLWSIASVRYSDQPAEEVVKQIQLRNGLRGSFIQVGQSILLP